MLSHCEKGMSMSSCTVRVLRECIHARKADTAFECGRICYVRNGNAHARGSPPGMSLFVILLCAFHAAAFVHSILQHVIFRLQGPPPHKSADENIYLGCLVLGAAGGFAFSTRRTTI